MIAMPAAGFLCALIGCWTARRDAERLWAWATVMLMTAFAIGLCFWQIRAAPAAQLLAIPPIGWAAWALLARIATGPRIARRALATLGLAALATPVYAYQLYPIANRAILDFSEPHPEPEPKKPARAKTPDQPLTKGKAGKTPAPANTSAPVKPATKPGSTANARCRTQPALAPLDKLPPATIFTMVDLGPRLIAVTHHSVIAGPYHRNGTAILDIHHAFDGSPARFREIAAAHGATYLLVCPGFPEGTIYQQRSPKGFYARLMRKEKFDFLEPVPLDYPAPLPYQLYRIAPETEAAAIASPRKNP
jgi:hypothetical protein